MRCGPDPSGPALSISAESLGHPPVMTAVCVTPAVAGALVVALVASVGPRDRARLSSADDSVASQAAAAEAERHGVQGINRVRDNVGDGQSF